MDSTVPSQVSEGKKGVTHSETRSSTNTSYQSQTQPFCTEEKCYMAHHVNQCFDFQNLCEMTNLQFCTNRKLDSMKKFFSRCDETEFFDLTEQAQGYKWCKPHPTSAIVPPSMVLGTAEWRTELRAFVVYQASKNMMLSEIERTFNTTFSGESRTSEQIAIHLSNINQNQGLFLQLKRFAQSYPWYPLYNEAVSASPMEKTKPRGKAAARERNKQTKQKGKIYGNSQGALAVQLELMK